ncbi:MAG: carbon-nitrogen hydrolase family protein [Lachnospiraceae bacterium]|nr:carbon-nitrogen hydrolase family protein [Lachnospiraceae bacterium]
MRVVQLQTPVSERVADNLAQLSSLLESLRDKGADLVCLGEMFACPYDTANFPRYAEAEGGDTWQALSRMAREYGIYLSAGSLPEAGEGGRTYNTAYVFDREGRQIAKHRKVHLFDVDIRGGQRFKESETLSVGDQITVFDTEFGRMGLAICFDMRFPELARRMAEEGARTILAPAAFNMTTGPAHWELMFRSRAVDNQCYVIGTSVARDEAFNYVAWGHSLVADPWGRVLSELGAEPGMAVTDIDPAYVEEVRQQLPLLSARRRDLY